LVTNTAVVAGDVTTVAKGDATVQIGTLNVVGNADGTFSTATYTTSRDPVDGKTSGLTVTNLDLGRDNAIVFQGGGTVYVAASTGGSSATITVSGSTMSGVLNVPVLIAVRNDNEPTLDVKEVLRITERISGAPGSSVRVLEGGVLQAPNRTIDSDVSVKGGTITVGDTSISGKVDIDGGRVQINTTDDKPPRFDNFNSCKGGVIYYHVDKPCSSLGGKKGTVFTSSVVQSDFDCRIVITGNDCEIDLRVKWTGTSRRRLLGTESTTSDCDSAGLSNGGANYSLCVSRLFHSGAVRSSLSYIALLATLLMALVLRL